MIFSFRRFARLLSFPACVAIGFGLSGTAHAGVLVQYNSTYTGTCGTGAGAGAAADTVASGLTASNWTLTAGHCYDAGDLTGLGGAGTAIFSFTVTADAATSLASLSFHESNNDSEVNGFVFGSTGASWNLDGALNGGAATTLGSFVSGAPYTDHLFSFNTPEVLAAGASYTFSIVNTSGPVISTANYGFGSVELDGSVVPEPISLALFGSGLAGLTLLRRYRA